MVDANIAIICALKQFLEEVSNSSLKQTYVEHKSDFSRQRVLALKRESITLFDRGYPGCCLICLLQQQGSLFVMRAKESFNGEVKNFMASSEKDMIT
jgi:hypothetical protein